MSLVINAILFLVAAYWLHQGVFVYKFWVKGLPGNGFIPVLFSLVLMAFTVHLIIQDVKKRRAASDQKEATEEPSETPERNLAWIRPFVPIVYAILAIFAFRLLGVVISMFLTSFIWLIGISKEKLGKSLLISTILTLAIYVIFVAWLRIPFPRGIFGF